MPPATEKKAFQPAKIRQVIAQTPDTHTLRLDTYFDFRPGQFIQVMLPGDPKIRSYSLCSSPTERGFIDITVKAEPGGHLSNLLISLKGGDTLNVKGPFGNFGLPDPPLTRPLVFLPASTGVAAFRAMTKHLIDTQAPVSKWMFYSARTPNDLIFHKELEAWAAQDSKFRYIPTVTRSFEGSWSGEKGRINEALLRKHLPKIEGLFYLCGPSSFMTSMIQLLSGPLKVPATDIRRETW